MADFKIIAIAISISFCASTIGTFALCHILKSTGIVDTPNSRSSHSQPTPRGGGIAFILAIAFGVMVLFFFDHTLLPHIEIITISAFVLASVSWIDDLRPLPALIRFIPQIFCVGFILYVTPLGNIGALGFMPTWAQSIIVGLAWLWFINLFNFMDGIDGISGIQTIIITCGIITIATSAALPSYMIETSAIIAAASVGFLIWNWPPSKIFLGDVGSITLGFLLGWALLQLAIAGYTLAAIIIPGYYLADATHTLCHRLFKGEKIWQAHRQHAYQQAVQHGMSHTMVTALTGLLGVFLVFLSVMSLSWPITSLIFAFALIASLLLLFHGYFLRAKSDYG
jgi:UDP-N-acetylmuramyl pentapeptide phosphotransferase/UDP-N-acetylglucosamine-1-phosphate transferase